MNFFVWYFTRGLKKALWVALDLMRFIPYFFNLGPLLVTLISPWRRDVSYHSWRGFHPLLFLQATLNNLFSRFMGLLVRVVVVAFGFIVWIATIPLAILFFLVYLAAFPLVLSALPMIVFYPLYGAGIVVITGIVLLGAFLVWTKETHYEAPLGSRDVPWAKRALMRLGFVPDDDLASLLRSEEKFEAALRERNLDLSSWQAAESLEREAWARRESKTAILGWNALRKSGPIGKYWIYGYTPHLDRYLLDLSQPDPTKYRNLELIGHASAWEMLLLTLTRPTGNSALLVGEPGIGKKTIVHTLARRLRSNELMDTGIGRARVVLLDLGEIIGEARNAEADIKNAVRRLFDEAVYAGNVILVIDSIDQYLAVANPDNLSEVFHEYLGLPNCRVIGLTTPSSYHTLTQEQAPALKYFEPIVLTEPTEEETVRILVDFFSRLESKRPVFTLSGLRSIVESAKRFNWEVPFPERAIDLAEETLLFWEKNPSRPFIDTEVVNAFLSLKSGVPQGEVEAPERSKLLNLETLLHERIVGQEEAIRQIAEAFRKARSGLGNDERPVGSFLFLGPTGVGKTETAKALAHVYYGSEEHMVRLDMSEFQTQQSVADLIGSENDELSGRMTTLVKEQPFSILLLDEIEKAHPRVLDIFLQILDEGCVTDGFGRKVNFRNLIIIATSNAGAALIREATTAGKSMEEIKKELIDRIIEENSFRPEFLNRFDGIILFDALSSDEIHRVTEMKLQAFAQELLHEKKIRLSFTPDLIPALIEKGYEPEFGVRSINRYISDVVEDALVKKILSGEVREGGSVEFGSADL